MDDRINGIQRLEDKKQNKYYALQIIAKKCKAISKIEMNWGVPEPLVHSLYTFSELKLQN